MKKLSLLLLLMSVAYMTLAAGNVGAPTRIGPDSIAGNLYRVFPRTIQGSAVNPVTHDTYVPQDGLFEILYDASGDCYIKNIVYGSEREFGEYWVYAIDDQEGGFYVPLNQAICWQSTSGKQLRGGRKAVLAWGTVSYNSATGQATFVRDASVSGVTYSMDGRTIHIENTSGPVAVDAEEEVSYDATGLGIVWENTEDAEEYEWAGYCEWGTGLDSNPFVIDYQPEGEMKTYVRTGDCVRFSGNGSKAPYTTFSHESLTDEAYIVFGNDGESVYLKDPLMSMKYGTWVVGTIRDGGYSIVVYNPQYLWAYDNMSVAYFDTSSGHIETANGPNGTPVSQYVVGGNEYSSMEYVIGDNTITLRRSYANFDATYPEDYFIYGIYGFDTQTDEGAIEANIVYTLKSDPPVEPTEQTSAPVINGYADEDNQCYHVEISQTEPSTVYYRVQLPNGSYNQWTKYTEALIFTEKGDYVVEAYAVAEEKLPSEHATYEFSISSSTGISELADSKQIANVHFYNVMGQETQQPNGITIIVITYTDGTTTTTKVVR